MKFSSTAAVLAFCAASVHGFSVNLARHNPMQGAVPPGVSHQDSLAGGTYSPISSESVYPKFGSGARPDPYPSMRSRSYHDMYISMQDALAEGEYAPISPASAYPEYGPGAQPSPLGIDYSMMGGAGYPTRDSPYSFCMQNALKVGEYATIHPESAYRQFG